MKGPKTQLRTTMQDTVVYRNKKVCTKKIKIDGHRKKERQKERKNLGWSSGLEDPALVAWR